MFEKREANRKQKQKLEKIKHQIRLTSMDDDYIYLLPPFLDDCKTIQEVYDTVSEYINEVEVHTYNKKATELMRTKMLKKLDKIYDNKN